MHPVAISAWIVIVAGACSARSLALEDDAGVSVVDASVDVSVDAPPEIPADAFLPGVLDGRPPRSELLPLPGGGVGGPVLTSNNPEIVTGTGVLFMNRASPTRGGGPFLLQGEFGIYLHHLNQAGATRAFSILVTNPGSTPVTVTLRGSGYSQGETGGLPLGASPDYRVSRDWILDQPQTTATASIAPSTGEVLWSKLAANNQEVDGRFAVTTSGPVFVYVVMAADSSREAALAVSQPVIDAPGDYRVSGEPPPPFGREAGIYANDTWRAVFDVELPAAPGRVSLMVNTATGGGLSQVQAFPALMHYTQSAKEAVGMYGNVYDLDLGLRDPRPDGAARRVRVAFHSLATGTASRWWDGAATLDGAPIELRHVPGSETTVLFDGSLAGGARRRVRLRAMVPGLSAIPQALTVEVF
ncbi:MAG: DUF3370 family protein [Proteobacteria bacterium]|nr:DUF3370 family protein [Pseudomonadota bacterium]